jgi:hypothetical protein
MPAVFGAPEVGGCRVDHLWRYIEMLFQQTESNA